jgi:uncharacterized protein (DUF983 family)
MKTPLELAPTPEAPAGTATGVAPVLRGFRRRCPCCGEAPLFRGYLKPVARCARCGTELGHIHADDFPPYLTILAVGHLVVPMILLAEWIGLSTAQQIAVWVPVTLLLTLLLLPRFKGAIIGLMWSLDLGGARSTS